MKQEQEPQGTRRQFLVASFLPLLRSLKSPNHQWRSDQDRFLTKERSHTPIEGDVVVFGRNHYLLRNGERYLIPDFERYRYLSKLDEYGRRAFVNPGREYADLPRGEVPGGWLTLDPFTSQPKANKPFGGEINIFFPGFLTDGGVLFESLEPTKKLFRTLRGEGGLGSLGWKEGDEFFFTYGVGGVEVFNARDTAQHPLKTIQDALDFIQVIKEHFPLVQVNIFAHSLGTVPAIEIAKRHQDVINNLVLISGPVRGLRRSFLDWRMTVWEATRQGLKTLGIDEKVSKYLFDLWSDKDHQRELDEFVGWFTSLGKRILEFGSEGDLIVPKESMLLRGKNNSLNGKEVPSVWRMGPFNEPFLHPHWIAAEKPEAIVSIMEAFGQNRAAA